MGWIHHDVPGCPVPSSTEIIVRFKDETRDHAEWLGPTRADGIGWNAPYRPIEYRLAADVPQGGNSE